MLYPSLLLIVAVVVLYFGAEFTLEASEKVGKKIGLSPLMIGMLLIGFGTSLPEFFVGHIAGVRDQAGIAIGSLIGSNIANMCLILGVCGLCTTLQLSHRSVRDQLIFHVILGFVLWFVLTRENLTVITASPLILLCGAYLFSLFRDLKQDRHLHAEEDDDFNAGVVFIKLLAGFGMLYLGGELLVKSGTDLCSTLGISEYIVSAIFLAFGTSFPELVTAIMAIAKKKDTDLIVGNIVGSNMFNCAFILGSLGIYDFKIEGPFGFELSVLIGGAIILLTLSLLKKSFFRLSGVLFLGFPAASRIVTEVFPGLIPIKVISCLLRETDKLRMSGFRILIFLLNLYLNRTISSIPIARFNGVSLTVTIS